MMNQRDLEVLSRFDDVWQRVQNQSAPRSCEEIGLLETSMDGLEYLHSGYCQLARRAAGETRRRLNRLSEHTAKCFSRLQFRYFLETGDLYNGATSVNFASYTLVNLRILWQSASEYREKLQKANLKDASTFIAEMEMVQQEFAYHIQALEALMQAFFP